MRTFPALKELIHEPVTISRAIYETIGLTYRISGGWDAATGDLVRGIDEKEKTNEPQVIAVKAAIFSTKVYSQVHQAYIYGGTHNQLPHCDSEFIIIGRKDRRGHHGLFYCCEGCPLPAFIDIKQLLRPYWSKKSFIHIEKALSDAFTNGDNEMMEQMLKVMPKGKRDTLYMRICQRKLRLV